MKMDAVNVLRNDMQIFIEFQPARNYACRQQFYGNTGGTDLMRKKEHVSKEYEG